MSGSRRIGLIVDHPKRDLAGCLLVAHELAKRELEVFLIPQYEQGIDVPLLALDSLVLNYGRPANLELAKDYAQAGIATYVLDTEGGILADDGPNTPANLASYVRTSGFAEILTGYFFWGSELKVAFARDGAMTADSLHLTGCPRFDFACPSLRSMRPGRYEGHVLVNTNYPAVNSRFAGDSDDRDALASVGLTDSYITKMLHDTREIMAGMIETVQKLAELHPGQLFVVRPHPFENDRIYRHAFARFGNVSVDGRGDVFEALSGARALLHLNCGTAVEALMLNVIPYSLEFLNTEHMRQHASLPSRVSRSVTSMDELIGLLADDAETVAFDFGARYTRFIEPYFHLNDGEASVRVAEILASEALSKHSVNKPSLRRSLRACRQRPRLSQLGQSAFANLIGSYATSGLRNAVQRRRRQKGIGLSAVETFLCALDRHDGGDVSTTVERARHPLSGLPLATLRVRPKCAENGSFQ